MSIDIVAAERNTYLGAEYQFAISRDWPASRALLINLVREHAGVPSMSDGQNDASDKHCARARKLLMKDESHILTYTSSILNARG